MTTFYKAGWSQRLLGITMATLALFVYIGYQAVMSGESIGLLIIVLLVVGIGLLAVRGYSVTDEAIIVHRIGWQTTLPLATLDSVEIDPAATVSSLRTFGIGGLFGFIGQFRNERLGSYTAYVTNGLNSVVLRYPDKTIVVSSDNPAVFVEEIEQRR